MFSSVFKVLMAALLYACVAGGALAQGNPPRGMVQNKGQWPAAVTHYIKVPAGEMFIEKGGFTYRFSNMASRMEDYQHAVKNGQAPSGPPQQYTSSVVKMRFAGDVQSPTMQQTDSLEYHYNYYLGNDSSRWAENVPSVRSITHRQIYEGIDLHTTFNGSKLKYELHLEAGASPSAIKWNYQGQERIRIDKQGNLRIATPLCDITEMNPVAYQVVNGRKQRVTCDYSLTGNMVQFSLGQGYDASRPLVIDPEIVFSSYVGSNSDNFGFTASYDDEGSLYGGCIVFGNDYPVTSGTYDSNFNLGDIDIGISKFSPDGANLEYSTYLGGSGNEAPHSLVVNNDNELYIFGTTGSSDFPTQNAYQPNFEGGSYQVANVGIIFENGTDLYISRLSASGGSLDASTYVGGSSDDGINGAETLNYNYGDDFRGEIVVGPYNDIYVASVTEGNFPTTPGGWQSNFGGGNTDGCVFRMAADLSQMVWGSYVGGSDSDALYSVQFGADNSVFVAGGTLSDDIDIPSGAFQEQYAGGGDGLLMRLSNDGQQLLAGTLTGNDLYNQCYFVQVGPQGNVYTLGQKRGAWSFTNGAYQNPNSGQFIQKFNPELTDLMISTEFGTGSGDIDISPSAFLVSNCGHVYVSGWGGSINNSGNSSTEGLPISSDAFQSSTDGNDFYLAVFADDMAGLNYATFFGGSNSLEHVDGGTSRFDKNGTVYQAVCAGCGGNSDFPTQPGVWSQNNDASNCNLGVFKFELAQIAANVSAPDTVCLDQNVEFENNSSGSNTYQWNFGDGQTTTNENPVHSYDEPGTYQVTLNASDSDDCLSPDTYTFEIVVEDFTGLQVNEPAISCPEDSIQLVAYGAEEYSWQPNEGLSDNQVSNPMAAPSANQTYTVYGSGFCGEEALEVDVELYDDELTLIPDTTICPNDEFELVASGATDAEWTPSAGLDTDAGTTVTVSPDSTTTYAVTGLSPNDCEIENQVTIDVLDGPPELELPNEVNVCVGTGVTLEVGGADTYEWQDAPGLQSNTGFNPTAYPPQDIQYIVTGFNQCGSDTDTIPVFTRKVDAQLSGDTLGCVGKLANFGASGGVRYDWRPIAQFGHASGSNASAVFYRPTMVYVHVHDEYGCVGTDSTFLDVRDLPDLNLGNNYVIDYGESAQIDGRSPFPIVWEPAETLSCLNCDDPVASPLETTAYYASATSPDGCTRNDTVTISVLGSLYVPNAFTPNEDGKNDLFKASGITIEEFRMDIYDRWGRHIYTINHIDEGWNGAIEGGNHYAKPGVYIWKLRARDINAPAFTRQGHVTLIR